MKITQNISVSGGGLTINKQIDHEVDHPNPYGPVTLPVGTAGTLTTRTADDDGVVTAAGHGLAQNDLVDVYWELNGVPGVRYGMLVGVVAGNDVPVTGGAGDVLPADETAVVISEQVQINTAIDGDALSIAAIHLAVADGAVGKGHVDFQDSGSASIEALSLVGNKPRVWDIENGDANPFTGNPITKCKASNGSATVAATLVILTGEDSTPG